MDDVRSPIPNDGIKPHNDQSTASVAAARRRSIHVHATPPAAVAEMDTQSRRWAEWLANTRENASATSITI